MSSNMASSSPNQADPGQPWPPLGKPRADPRLHPVGMGNGPNESSEMPDQPEVSGEQTGE
jgi:hypothetical protein